MMIKKGKSRGENREKNKQSYSKIKIYKKNKDTEKRMTYDSFYSECKQNNFNCYSKKITSIFIVSEYC